MARFATMGYRLCFSAKGILWLSVFPACVWGIVTNRQGPFTLPVLD